MDKQAFKTALKRLVLCACQHDRRYYIDQGHLRGSFPFFIPASWRAGAAPVFTPYPSYCRIHHTLHVLCVLVQTYAGMFRCLSNKAVKQQDVPHTSAQRCWLCMGRLAPGTSLHFIPVRPHAHLVCVSTCRWGRAKHTEWTCTGISGLIDLWQSGTELEAAKHWGLTG